MRQTLVTLISKALEYTGSTATSPSGRLTCCNVSGPGPRESAGDWDARSCLSLLTTAAAHLHAALSFAGQLKSIGRNQLLAHLNKKVFWVFKKMHQNKNPSLGSTRSRTFSAPVSPALTYSFVQFSLGCPRVRTLGRGEHPSNHGGRVPQSHSLTSERNGNIILSTATKDFKQYIKNRSITLPINCKFYAGS